MKQPTFFIEQISKASLGNMIYSMPVMPIKELNNQLRISAKFNVNTIALFKIYPKA